MIIDFCGSTKGKTSSALGTVVRALGHNKSVRMVFFMKHWNTSEVSFFKGIRDQYDIQLYQAGDDDFIFVKDLNRTTLDKARKQLKFGKVQNVDETDIENAQKGLLKAWQFLESDPFLIVMDEVLYAIEFGLLEESQVEEFLLDANKRGVHVIVTGRSTPTGIAPLCDLITEMTKVKHPYDKGTVAVKGLDY